MIRTSFDRNWFVVKETEDSTGEPSGPLTLPHDAMMFERRSVDAGGSHNTGFYPGGTYRYSKTFMAPIEWRHSSVVVEFEGVFHRSEIRINGYLAGGRPSGYATFRIPLDGLLRYGEENRIEVIARNDQQPNSRWYTGSGIYRPVHLLVGPLVRVTPGGPRLRTITLRGLDADIEVTTDVTNSGAEDRRVDVDVHLTDPAGVTVATSVAGADVPAGSTVSVRHLVTVAKAELWGPETPSLYHASATVTPDTGAQDTAEDDFGIRTIDVDARRGLRINGVPTKLRGACIHHDNGVIGAHALAAADERRIRLLKEAGFNAIRIAHNPASPALLRECDRQGMLVMDELADMWFSTKNPHDYGLDFERWWERDLESMVEKDYNRPSVIMYSIGNEISETAQPKGIALNRAIADLARELDPTRPVTNCLNGFLNLLSATDDAKAEAARATKQPDGKAYQNGIVVMNHLMSVLDKVMPYIVRLPAVDKRTRDAFADVDVAGYNYMQGRYAGDTKRHPDRVIVGSETNPSSLVKRWPLVEKSPNILGEFVWTGWDYIGEAGLATTTYDSKPQVFKPFPALLAGTPIIDITGHFQSQTFHNRILWGLDTGPHLAVQPLDHSHQKVRKSGWRNSDSVASWSWEGHETTPAEVEVYADAARVELRLNGRAVGSKPCGAAAGYLARFTVPYRRGELVAIAFDAAGREIGRDVLRSAGDGLRLTIASEVDHLVADGADLAYIPIEVTDADGILRPLATRRVSVTVEGPGTLLGLGSAEPTVDEGFDSGTHSTFYGRALAVIRASHEEGEITATFSADGCEDVTLTLPVRASASSTTEDADAPH